MGYGDEEYDTEYEAHYRLIHVQEADLHRWTARCSSDDCEWSVTEYTCADARHVALAHCREKHVRMVWSRDRW